MQFVGEQLVARNGAARPTVAAQRRSADREEKGLDDHGSAP